VGPHSAPSSEANNSSAVQPITVLIADPNELSRSGVRMLLSADPHFEIVADTATRAETLAVRYQPDLIIADPAQQRSIDQDLIARLRQSAPSSRIVVLTSVFEPYSFMATMLQQVHGYLLKDSISQRELVRGALLLIAHFGVVVTDASIARQFWSYQRTPITVHLPHGAALSLREVEILTLSIQGLTDKEIAERLTLTRRTVDHHIEQAASKLGARHRLQLGWLLHERGLL
jgi:two-component system response regulator NreC